jgi:hypothetical protein
MYYCKKIKGCHYDVHIWTNFAFLMYISELVFLIIPFIFTNVTTRDGYNWSKQRKFSHPTPHDSFPPPPDFPFYPYKNIVRALRSEKI